MPNAAPKGWFLPLVNCFWIVLPINSVEPPPMRVTMANIATAGTNTSIAPPATPGIVSGSVTLRNARHGPAPRSYAASTSVRSSFSTLA